MRAGMRRWHLDWVGQGLGRIGHVCSTRFASRANLVATLPGDQKQGRGGD